MAGFVGFTFTSTTGARSRSIPALAIVAAIERPASNASSGSPLAPTSACDRVAGKPRAGWSRETRPPSWSMATIRIPLDAARSEAVRDGELVGGLDVPGPA